MTCPFCKSEEIHTSTKQPENTVCRACSAVWRVLRHPRSQED